LNIVERLLFECPTDRYGSMLCENAITIYT
jgi:hypothetical protein